MSIIYLMSNRDNELKNRLRNTQNEEQRGSGMKIQMRSYEIYRTK